MYSVDRILGESTSKAFNDLMELCSKVLAGEPDSGKIQDLFMNYKNVHGASRALSNNFEGLIFSASDIEDEDRYSDENNLSYTDLYNLRHRNRELHRVYLRDLFYSVIETVQSGEMATGDLTDLIMQSDPFGEGPDLREMTPKSKPYIDAIARVFNATPDEVMSVAKYSPQI
jgi:hypothetical protein